MFEEIMQAISTVGFPCAVSLYLLYQNKESAKAHSAETDKFVEALNKNTLVLQKLCDSLGVEREE